MLQEIAHNAWHIPILMAMILVYGFLLNRALFKPIQQTLEERKRRVKEAGDLSAHSRDALKSRFQEYELAILEAHRRATHVKEDARNEAYRYRSQVLSEVKADMAKELAAAEAELDRSAEEVRRDLKAAAPGLAGMLASKILGREVAV